MNPIAILREVEADVKSLGSISTDIRAKLKAGVADLTAIRDEMDTVVETVMSKAKGALASLKSVADEVSKDADNDTADDAGAPAAVLEPAPAPSEAPVDAAPSEAPAPAAPTSVMAPSGAMVTVDPTIGTTVHEAEDGTTTVIPHDGSEPTAHDAAMQPADVKPEAVQEAVQASADAGVTVSAPAPAAL